MTFAARLSHDVICAAEVVTGIDAADLPMTFLRPTIIVSKASVEPEYPAAHPAMAISGEALLSFADCVIKDAG